MSVKSHFNQDICEHEYHVARNGFLGGAYRP